MKTKHVRFSESFSVKFPPSNKFTEPANMVNVDLEPNIPNNKNGTPEGKFQLKLIWKKLVACIIGTMLVGLTTVTLIQILANIRSDLTDARRNGEEENPGYTSKELSEIIDIHRDKLRTCKLTREYVDCCITAGKTATELIMEDCSVDKVLEIMLNYDITNPPQQSSKHFDIEANALKANVELGLRNKRQLKPPSFSQLMKNTDINPVIESNGSKNLSKATLQKEVYYNNKFDGLKQHEQDYYHGKTKDIWKKRLTDHLKNKSKDASDKFQVKTQIKDTRANIFDTNLNLNLEDTEIDIKKYDDNSGSYKYRAKNLLSNLDEDKVGQQWKLQNSNIENSQNNFQTENIKENNNRPIDSRQQNYVTNNKDMNTNFLLVPNSKSFQLKKQRESPLPTESRISSIDFQKNKNQFSAAENVLQSNQHTDPTVCIPYSQLQSALPLVQQQIPFSPDFPRYQPVYPFSMPSVSRGNYFLPTVANSLWPSYSMAYAGITPSQSPSYSYFGNQNANPSNVVAPSQIQASGPGGKFYVCNPVPDPASNVASIPGVEIRTSRTASNLQEMVGSPVSTMPLSNLSRASSHCPRGERMCGDDSKCIKSNQICDGEVHCDDGSDEAYCSCKFRVGESRWCDGYFDCPFGEDEVGCFGCDENSISCDDWTEEKKVSTCISFEERCDGIPQCPSRKDEEDCVVLIKEVGKAPSSYQVSDNVGYLHRNHKGIWYPACGNAEVWAKEACDSESGPSELPPLTHLIPVKTKYRGKYINALPNNGVELVRECVQGRAVYVECPQPTCGMRKINRNPFREEEVDTSVEKILSRYSHGRTAEESVPNDSFVGDSRIVGGKPSQPGAWPWVVLIYRNGIFHCGGAIVSPSWVITAAHCVAKYWQYYFEVTAGILRRFSYCPMQQTRHAEYIITRPDYDRSKLKHDLALIKLADPIMYNRYVRPICMPSEVTAGNNFRRNPAAGTICTAVGWGATIEHGYDPDHLREVEVPILSHCKHREDEEGDGICAGLSEGGKDACQGDSGGPFLCRNPNFPNQWYLAGITSHGEGCARPDEPGVYTRVSKYNDWIYHNARSDRLPKKQALQKCPGYVCNLTGKCLPKKRRCDRIIDCLAGDDELNCDHSFNSLFKHALNNMFPASVGDVVGKAKNLPGSLSYTNSPTSITIDKMTFEVTTTTDNIFDTTFKMESGSPGESMNRNGFGFIEDGTSFASAPSVSDGNRYISNRGGTYSNAASNIGLNTQNYEVDESSLEFVGGTESTKSDFPQTTYSTVTVENDTDTEISKNFVCTDLMQVIPIERRCDKVFDCEDATDEINCTCSEYMKKTNPKVICDGYTDCYDSTDELNCEKCSTSEYHCRKSDECIPLSSRCDGVRDCKYEEDERDCFALSDGATMEVDEDLRPFIKIDGIVVFNGNGTWMPLCANWTQHEASFAQDMCLSLGFSEYKKYLQLTFPNKQLQVKIKGSSDKSLVTEQPDMEEFAQCSVLYVKCSNNSFDYTQQLTDEIKYNNANDLYAAPWNAAIYANGDYKCTGILFSNRWILTTVDCYPDVLRLHHSYVCVLLGSFRRHIDVGGPHDQVIRVVESVNVPDTSIVLMRTEYPAEYTRYVRPLQLKWKDHLGRLKETCYAMGLDEQGKYTNVFLRPTYENCTFGYLCLGRLFKEIGACSNKTDSSPWSGTIICDYGEGLYPAATYFDAHGLCGFRYIKHYENLVYFKRSILKSMEYPRYIIPAPHCETFRCKTGLCLNETKICDGRPDCSDASDEDVNMCVDLKSRCEILGNCKCNASEIKCNSGECLPKSKFCNGIKECKDSSDEPNDCTCREYYTLTNASKICDGIVNCIDSSDETNCDCAPDRFKCGNNKCISKEMVCDSYIDCPNGEDEKTCLTLLSTDGRFNSGEVISQSSGIWHKGCFKQNLTILELEDICRKIGFASGSAQVIRPPGISHNSTVLKPVFGTFSMVKFPSPKFSLALRSERDSFLTFAEDSSCYRLFVEC